jgi:hypothetical protein
LQAASSRREISGRWPQKGVSVNEDKLKDRDRRRHPSQLVFGRNLQFVVLIT